MLLITIPTVYMSSGCFQRIQKFLLQDSRLDQRILGLDTDSKATFDANRVSLSDDIELQSPSKRNAHSFHGGTHLGHQITVKAGKFGWSDETPSVINDA